MKNKSLKKIAASALLTIWIGGAIIIATEIFILDESREISLANINFYDSRDINPAELAALRNNHKRYMEEGIVPQTIVARAPKDPLSPVTSETDEYKELIDPGPEPELSMDYIIAQQRDLEAVSLIEPAAGIEGDYRPEVSINKNNPFEKTLDDVLAEITPAANDASITPKDINQEKNNTVSTYKNIEPDPSAETKSAGQIHSEYTYTEPAGHGLIAIIIDDMGLTLRSKIIENMDAPLTLSYLPNAQNIKERTLQAKKNGHEIMLHMPMQPYNESMDDGSIMLRTDQSDEEFSHSLDWSFDRTNTFVGVNNHMGSKLTSDKQAMNKFMRYIKDKNIFFIDSKTISSTVAAQTAREYGIAYAERDVFLDHEISADFIERALRKTEVIAKKKGYAIAIAHPHKETITALKKWLPTLEEKGLTLVPASKLVKQPIRKSEPKLASQ